MLETDLSLADRKDQTRARDLYFTQDTSDTNTKKRENKSQKRRNQREVRTLRLSGRTK